MTTRSQSVTRSLRDRILSGEYAGGMRMNEIDLATNLGVSRTPIRGALSTLAAEGLLDYTPNSGYVVRTYTSKDIAAIYEVRAALEGLSAKLAAEKGLSDEQRGQMHKVLAEGDEIVAEHQWTDDVRKRWAAVNERFHALLHDAADNAHLELVLRKSRDIPILSHIRFQWYDADNLVRAHDDHREIFDAIVNGQVARAEALATEHVYRSGRRLVQQWRRVESRRQEKAPRPKSAA